MAVNCGKKGVIEVRVLRFDVFEGVTALEVDDVRLPSALVESL